MAHIDEHDLASPSVCEKRLSVPLKGDDIDYLATLRLSPETLRALPGSPAPDASEARLVRAVFEAGLERVREMTDLAGYRDLAADADYRAYHGDRRDASPRFSRD